LPAPYYLGIGSLKCHPHPRVMFAQGKCDARGSTWAVSRLSSPLLSSSMINDILHCHSSNPNDLAQDLQTPIRIACSSTPQS
jgi:hypothetical protein